MTGPKIHCESLVTCSSLSYHKRLTAPCRSLMVAVLKSVLQDVASADQDSVLYRDAYKWCMEVFPYSGEYEKYLFSLDSICLYLQIDKAYIQKVVKHNYAR